MVAVGGTDPPLPVLETGVLPLDDTAIKIKKLFHKPFAGQGMYLTIEVDDVDKIYNDLKKKGVVIEIDIRNEPWGDRHFAIQDPNGIGIDLVRYNNSN